MAEHNGIKFDTQLQVMLDRLGGVGLDDDGVTRFGETLTPVYNWRDLYEWYAVASRNLCGGSVATVAAGGAGNRSILVLDNGTTNVIAICRRIYSTGVAGAATNLAWLLASATATTTDAGAAVFLDWRKQNISPPGQTGVGIPRLTIRTKNNAAIPTNRLIAPLKIAAAPGAADLCQPCNIIIAPQSTLAIITDTDNVALGHCGFEWEERQLLSGEPAVFKSAN